MRGFYFITDEKLSRRGNTSDVCTAIDAGVQVIQYRCKDLSTQQMIDEAEKLRSMTQRVLFLINDYIDVALAVDADGVHLGQNDIGCDYARKILGNYKKIGISVTTVEQAKLAQEQGADYLGVGPIFATETKTDAGKPLGVEIIKQIKSAVALPVVAIGGMTLDNAAEAIAAGADSISAISAVLTKPDLKSEILKFQSLFP